MRDNENGNFAYPASATAVEEDSEAEDVIMVEYYFFFFLFFVCSFEIERGRREFQKQNVVPNIFVRRFKGDFLFFFVFLFLHSWAVMRVGDGGK